MNTAFMNDLKQFSQQTNLGESWGQVLQASESLAATRAGSIGDSDSRSVSASLRSAVDARSAASASLTEAEAWEMAAARVEQSGFAASFDAVGALKANMVGQEKGLATPGNNSATWTDGEVNRLFEAADRGDTQAIGILLSEAQRFGASEGLELAGVSADQGRESAPNAFYENAGSAIAGSSAAHARYAMNSEDVLYNDARSESDVAGKPWSVRADELSANRAKELIQESTEGKLEQVREDLENEGESARTRNADWRDANISGTVDDWIPGLSN